MIATSNKHKKEASDSLIHTPIQLRNLYLKNRVMFVATTTSLSSGGVVSDASIKFYSTRAAGGVGSIVVGNDARIGRNSILRPSAETTKSLHRLANAIQEHDVIAIAQLYHGGRQHTSSTIPRLVGPSPIPCPRSGGNPHELTTYEIAALVENFVATARLLQEAGYDGIELHGAQGHLIQQFMSPYSNTREDTYGGSLANRMRFADEILGGIVRECGRDFPIGVRIATGEYSPGGIDLAMSGDIAEHLVGKFQLTYLSLSAGNFNSIEEHLPDRHSPIAPLSSHSAVIRRRVAPRTAVVCAGRILTHDVAEELLTSGSCDLVGLSRPLIADPEWALKARGWGHGPIRPCISCNKCWGEVIEGRPIRCTVNPEAGRESELDDLIPITVPRTLVVVGGGPAGLEAARVAATRGARVVLFESRGELGGAVRYASLLDDNKEIQGATEFLSKCVLEAGVDVRLRSVATIRSVMDERPDGVVIATGAHQAVGSMSEVDELRVVSPIDILAGEVEMPPATHVVILDDDGYFQGCEVSLYLARRQCSVTLVTSFFEPGREIPMTSRIVLLRQMDESGVHVMPNSWLAHAQPGATLIRNVISGREWELDTAASLIVRVGGQKAQDDLYGPLRLQLPNVQAIGDARAPGRIADAILEGHLAGRNF